MRAGLCGPGCAWLRVPLLGRQPRPPLYSLMLAEAQRVAPCINPMERPRDVVLFGFGRIGRLLARILIEKTGGGGKLALRAIVVRKHDEVRWVVPGLGGSWLGGEEQCSAEEGGGVVGSARVATLVRAQTCTCMLRADTTLS